MASSQVIKALAVTAQIFGKELAEDAARVYAMDLGGYSEAAVLTALSRCRRELRTFPAIADIIARVDDGRPGAEEAWALLPKDEESSVVWCDEMREAFGTVRSLIADDPIAARMAFREVYTRLVSEARAERKAPRWEPSLGHDKTTHEPAIREAVRKGLLDQSHAATLLPEYTQPARLQIEGPMDSLQPMNFQALLANIRNKIAERKDPA